MATEGRSGEIPWIFGDKPITLKELLETSPEVKQLKKHNFSCEVEKRWGVRAGDKKTKAQPAPSINFNLATSTSAVDYSSSKLSLLDKPGPLEPSEPLGRRRLKKMKKEEREKTKGPGWFNMPATEVTEERKNDLEALQLRSVLDPKRFYKRNSIPTKPKYFQVGRILDNPLDFYRSRVPRKQRKKTLADEMVAEVSSTVTDL